MSDGRNFAAAHAAAASGAKPDAEALMRQCLDALGSSVHGHTLGFVFATDLLARDMPRILSRLGAATGIAHWVGGTGFGIVGGDAELWDRPALAVMTANLDAQAFHVVAAHGEGEPPEAASRWARAAQPLMGLVHGDPRNPSLPELLGGLADATQCFLAGGLTAARGPHAQVADAVSEGGLSGVLFGAGVDVATGLSQGCSPIGPVRRVSAAEGAVIVAIDGRPALDALRTDLGLGDAADWQRRLAQEAQTLHVALPVPGSDRADYLVRNLTGIDPDRGLIAIGDTVDPGDPILFCRRDRAAAEADLVRMARDLKRRLAGPPQAGVYYTCVARGPNLFGPDSQEVAILRRELGAFPLVGMFCNGEISNSRLYGYTGVLTLFL